MDNLKTNLKRRRIENIIFLAISAIVSAGVIYVLFFKYVPNKNSLGALASVCMDTISIAILLVLVLNLVFENTEMNRVTRLFLYLMVGTMYALFFDFLTWSYDGELAFGKPNYVYTMLSLCCGSILAGLFCLYLCRYMDEMYDMKYALKRGRVLTVLNGFSFLLTVFLGITNKAFDFVDGHYETGALYDLITVIPVLSILYMTGFAIKNIKKIGLHDVVAATGYILIMVTGATIESVYSIGTSYVSVTVANIFIFVMLQNKLIDREKKQKERLADEITSQYQILESMSKIYSHVNFVDLEEKIAKRFDVSDSSSEKLDLEKSPHTELNKDLYVDIDEEMQEGFWMYTDLSTLAIRMNGKKSITSEFRHKVDGWFRAQYIRIGDDLSAPIQRVIYAIRNIDEEKKNVEKWIRQSNTDELTGFYNRHAYEEEILALSLGRMSENFVYVSIDVNSLKMVNDTKGHEAGDELIIGASECMKQCFGTHGKLFRTGGDEFAALIYADEAQLEEIKKDVEEVTEEWSGKLNSNLAISCGYVTRKEAPHLNLHQIAVLADQRMYDDKNDYYKKQGIDRRGQKDAHVALCALYTKILKINISSDTYQIVNMNVEEQTKEKGFSDRISSWLYDFGTSGQVHPEDLEGYLSRTNLEYIGNYFKAGNAELIIIYRRKFGDEYKQTMMEIIPTNEYSPINQDFFLYVKNINE